MKNRKIAHMVIGSFLLCLSWCSSEGNGETLGEGDTVAGDTAGFDGESMDGLYKMVSHKKKANCGENIPWNDLPITKPFFMLKATTVQGKKILGYYECEGETYDTCSDTIMLFQSLVWENESWMYHLVGVMYLNGCQLSETKGTLEKTATGFTSNLTNRHAVLTNVSEEQCTDTIIDSVSDDQMTCQFKESYEAVRIE